MIRGGSKWLEALQRVPAALASGADPNLPFGPLGPTLVEAALLSRRALDAMLEAGADANATSSRGWPVLLEALVEHGVGDGKPLAEALVAHGARWDTPAMMDIGGCPTSLPVLLALPRAHRFQLESVFYALELWGADPSITDQWGGTVGHHMAQQCYRLHYMEQLEKLGVAMDRVARTPDEADLAWAKLSGEWLPDYAGLTPMQYWHKHWGQP